MFYHQASLSVLNISKNNIDEIRDLAPLSKLTHLNASDNKLSDIEVSENLVRFHAK